VTDFQAATRDASRSYCPRCDLAADPTREVLDVRWCDAHAPIRDGLEDGRVSFESSVILNNEAGGADNRRWCDLIHRRAR
jgi:hypothetical protein